MQNIKKSGINATCSVVCYSCVLVIAVATSLQKQNMAKVAINGVRADSVRKVETGARVGKRKLMDKMMQDKLDYVRRLKVCHQWTAPDDRLRLKKDAIFNCYLKKWENKSL